MESRSATRIVLRHWCCRLFLPNRAPGLLTCPRREKAFPCLRPDTAPGDRPKAVVHKGVVQVRNRIADRGVRIDEVLPGARRDGAAQRLRDALLVRCRSLKRDLRVERAAAGVICR